MLIDLWLGLAAASVASAAHGQQIPFISPEQPSTQSDDDTLVFKTFTHAHPAHDNSLLASGSSSPAGGYSSAHRRPFPITQIAPAIAYPLEEIRLRSKPAKVWRPRAAGGSDVYEAARQAHRASSRGLSMEEEEEDGHNKPLEWDQVDVEAPDVTDMDTLAGLAKLTSNAYVQGDRSKKNSSGWFDLPDWRLSDSFGWTEDGIRGHVFATQDNATAVVAIKGTSAGFVGGGGSTSGNDKINDNLFFSCCCARVDWSWSTVCDCYRGGYKCDETCVEDALIDKSVYYPHAVDLYNNVTKMFPEANIWLTGHSLGGSIAALLGMTFGVPAVTFEAPGDLMPAKRLHLPLPPSGKTENGALTHVYHTADPIPQGVCTGSLSSCGLVGFALESRCHTGQTILFDVVNELHWAVDVRTHSIAQVIEHVLKPDWDKGAQDSIDTTETLAVPRTSWPLSSWWGWGGKPKEPEKDKKPAPSLPKEGRSKSNVPEAKPEDDCMDCIKWEYGDFD